MIEEPIFRVITLILGMLILGYGWFLIQRRRLQGSGFNPAKTTQQAKKGAIHTSVIFAVLYMVVILGVSAYL